MPDAKIAGGAKLLRRKISREEEEEEEDNRRPPTMFVLIQFHLFVTSLLAQSFYALQWRAGHPQEERLRIAVASEMLNLSLR